MLYDQNGMVTKTQWLSNTIRFIFILLITFIHYDAIRVKGTKN